MQRLAGQAACDQQARQLGQIAAYHVGQGAAGFQQFRIDIGRQQQCGKHRLPVQADGRIEQPIGAHNALALMPEQLTVAADIQVGLEVAEVETFAAGWTAQGNHVPIEQACIALQRDVRCEFGLGRAEHDGFLGQPFERGAGFHGEVQLLKRRTFGAIPLGGAGAGQLHPGAGADVGADVQAITAGNASGRVHDDVLAHLGTFGIQVFLHAQWAEVAAHHRPCGVAETRVAEFQLGMPAGGEQGGSNGQVHGVVVVVRTLQISAQHHGARTLAMQIHGVPFVLARAMPALTIWRARAHNDRSQVSALRAFGARFSNCTVLVPGLACRAHYRNWDSA